MPTKSLGFYPCKSLSTLKENTQRRFDLQLAVQPLEGVLEPEAQKMFVQACEMADVIGGLPDRDEDPLAHMDFIFNLAKDMNKPVDVHVGQNNILRA